MVTRPYAHPLAQDSKFGRLMTRLWGADCEGNRMLQGEKMWRRNHVKNIIIYHDFNVGFELEAKVKSQSPLLCSLSQ